MLPKKTLIKVYNRGRWAPRRQTAKDKSLLKKLGVTHVLNAAEGTWNNVDTGAPYYADMDVVYYGVVAEDVTTFDLSPHFYPAARFIRETLSVPESKEGRCYLMSVWIIIWKSRSENSFEGPVHNFHRDQSTK